MQDDERNIPRMRRRIRPQRPQRRRRRLLRALLMVVMISCLLSFLAGLAAYKQTGTGILAGSVYQISPWVSLGIFIVIAGILRRTRQYTSRRLRRGNGLVARAARRAVRRVGQRISDWGGDEDRASGYRDDYRDDDGEEYDEYDEYEAYDDRYEKPKRRAENLPEKRKNEAPVHLGDDGELVLDDEFAQEDESPEAPRRTARRDQ